MKYKYLIYFYEEDPPVYISPVCVVDTELEAMKIVKQSNELYAYIAIPYNLEFTKVFTCYCDILVCKTLKGDTEARILSFNQYDELKANLPYNYIDTDESEFFDDKHKIYSEEFIDYHCIHIVMTVTANVLSKYGKPSKEYFYDLLRYKKIPEQIKKYYGKEENNE